MFVSIARTVMVMAILCRVDDGREKSVAIAMDDDYDDKDGDSFSTMPEHIIHHIMYFLPSTRDAIALSMVSKIFSSAFLSFPVIDFDLNHHSRFFSFFDSVLNFLQSRRAIRFDRLRFIAGRDAYLSSKFLRFRNSIIDTVFMLAADSDVKELELNVQKGFAPIHDDQTSKLCLSLPVVPPELFSSKTIRVLTLIGVSLPPQFQNQDLIISSPSMETLTLIHCSFLGSVALVRNGKLKRVEIERCRDIRVEGPIPCLEYFSCYCTSLDCKLDITDSICPKLKHLEFDSYVSPDPWIQQLCSFSQFRSLETLKLFGSCELKEIEFHLEYLKTLNLDSVDFAKIDVEAPNLVSLTYRSLSNEPPEINISSSSTNLKHLKFWGFCIPTRWVAQNFSEFSVLETLKLVNCYGGKEIKFQLEHLNALELVSAALKVEIEAPNLVSLIFESVLGAPPPEISIISSSTNLKHLQFKGEYVPRRWIANSFSEFSLLETLVLHAYSPVKKMKKIKFHLKCLKVLELFLYKPRFTKVEIVAPNLVSFMYKVKANRLVAPLLTLTSKAKPDVTFNVLSYLDPSHFPDLMNCLATFAHCCNTFTLRYMMSDYRGLIYPEELRKNLVSPFYKFNHLKAELVGLLKSSLAQLIDSLLWLAPHPSSLSFIVGSQVKSLKFYYKNEDVENWQHDLEEVVLENFKGYEVAILREYFLNLYEKKSISFTVL